MHNAPRLRSLALLAVLSILAPSRDAAATRILPDVLRPAGTGGVAAVDRALAALATHRRLLVIGAHPDDEDTTALTLVGRGMAGEAAYFALSRGEGGQNLIGEELGEALGVLRTNELLAARAVDGGRQYFSRAYDFGYTRSLEETLERWPEELLLEDAVRVVRRFRPQVILSVFGDDGSGGHGQHQAAGKIAHEVARYAADPAFRPDLGPPWAIESLFRSSWFRPEAATAIEPMGSVEPFSGHSLYQLAALSRSQHRSQDMGRGLDLGGRDGKYTREVGAEGSPDELFSGVDTRLSAIADALPAGALHDTARAALETTASEAAKARAALRPDDPASGAEPLARIAFRLAALRQQVAAGGAGAAAVAAEIEEKRQIALEGLLAASGIALDAEADREALVAGESVRVTARFWNGGGSSWRGAAVQLLGPDGLEVPMASRAVEAEREGAGLEVWEQTLELPAATPASEPYFLRAPRKGDVYDWSGADPSLRGEPFGPPPLHARFELVLPAKGDGPDRFVTIEREVVLRKVDQALGEIRRPLRVVPPVEVVVAKPLAIVTSAEPLETVEVEIRSNATAPLSGTLESRSDCRAQRLDPVPFELAPGERARFERLVRACPGPAGERTTTRFVARLADGREVDLALPLIEYPHVRPTPMPVAATVEVVPMDLVWPQVGEIAYVPGASDRVPAALAEAGLDVTLLTGRELADADLARFGAVVVGSRAYEADEALGAANARLLDYVKNGGLLVVQYQQYPFVRGGFAPFPMEIARPHDRVTDETSPVTVLAPADPVFTTPNAIGPADWRGWVQERSLYMPATFDAAYRPLLELQDPGQPAQRGALLVAPLGHGTYVYTGLAFFRQLPAGVPGAFRLFANLLALAGPEEQP
ncbi:MAG: PIG-L family deacetylase [Holophagales bacterium]|nr:PIG-L family deacetylase [Holophagales bacterium]